MHISITHMGNILKEVRSKAPTINRSYEETDASRGCDGGLSEKWLQPKPEIHLRHHHLFLKRSPFSERKPVSIPRFTVI